jgi:hypothetical protein
MPAIPKQVGTNKAGLPVYEYRTTQRAAEYFDGYHTDGRPRWKPCTITTKYVQ